MAVAAYAAVVSLKNVLDQILEYPSRLLLRFHLDRDQIDTLHKKVSFFQDFLEVHSRRFYEDLEGLARQIAAVVVEAEDIIDAHVVDQLISQTSADDSDIDRPCLWKLVADEGEDPVDSHVVDQLHKGSADKSDTELSFSCEGIDNMIEKMNSIMKELIMIKEGMTIQELGPRVSGPNCSSAPSSSGHNTMVGFDEHLDRIIYELIGDKCDLQVLAIVGMGGIGKTTLARNVFDKLCDMHHFDIHAWLTVSQEYSARGNLIGLLKELGDQKFKEGDQGLAKLGEQLYKKLYGRRYLIVMDDVWNTEVWDDLRSFFPNESNGSRVMVTTRLSPVADSLGCQKPYMMDFLDEDKSWGLFCEKAFAKDGNCPPQLEKVGKSIAKSCKGLPLAIIVIGGLLSKCKTQEYWECVAKDVNSFANSEDDEYCLKILSLSYNHLPIHLKPCFLHMRVFPEDDEILVDDLISFWIAEGFLKPIKDKTLEEVAEEYLDDLIGRNLILMCKLRFSGDSKKCRVHDLLRDLCIRESQKEHVHCVPRVQEIKTYELGSCFLCRSRQRCTGMVVSSQQTSLAHCSVCDKCRIKHPHLNKSRLVKVLDVAERILHPTKLRHLYIRFRNGKSVGNSIHLLWQLHNLLIVCKKAVLLPSKIWELQQLRVLLVNFFAVLPDPPLITEVGQKDSTIILKNLHTLGCIRNFRWSEDAIERIPNLKNLRIAYQNEFDEGDRELSYYSLHNLGHLHKLESLSLFLVAQPAFTLKNYIAFPHWLKILSLVGGWIPWEEMTIIGSLPNLEVLKLDRNAFKGPIWNPVEGEFLRLKRLTIWENDQLVHWGAEKVHFPILEHLELHCVQHLEEIPFEIGEIETLRSIKVTYCRASVNISAKRILEEQRSWGNEDLQIYEQFVSPYDSG